MKVTVITVCFNASATIRATLDSVRAQRGVAVEHLVVDGGSRDGTVELIRAFASEGARPADSSFAWISEPDRGMYDAINKGLARATGDVVGILNADDELENCGILAEVARRFETAGAMVEALYGDIRFVRGERTVRYYSARHWRPWMARWGYMVPHPSVYIRRETLARLGGYRLGYDISADFELMVRYFVIGRVRTTYFGRSLVKMRLGGKSTAGLRAMVRLNVENVRALRENGIWSCLPMMLPKYAYKVLGLVFKRGRAWSGEGRGDGQADCQG